MKQVLVGRIERMIDLEVLSPGKDCARDIDAAKKVSGPGAASQGIDSIALEVVGSSLEKSARSVGATSTLRGTATQSKNSRSPGRPTAAFCENSPAAAVAVVRLKIT